MFLNLLLLISTCLPAHAGIGDVFVELLAPPIPGRPRFDHRVSLTSKVYQAKSVHGTTYNADEDRLYADASFTLSKSEDQTWKLYLDSSRTAIHTNAALPNGQAIPPILWNASIGGAWMKKIEDRTLAVAVSLNSPSDEPFTTIRDTNADANVIYKIPRSNGANLLLFLSFSQTRGFLDNIPLPGIAYQFRPRENLGLVLGIPFFTMDWEPFEKTMLLLNFFPSRFGQIKFSYFLFGPAQIYAQANLQGKSYFLKNRGSNSERFYTEEGNINMGIAMPVARFMMADFSVGKTFEKKVFAGETLRDWHNSDKMRRIEGGTEASLRLNLLF